MIAIPIQEQAHYLDLFMACQYHAKALNLEMSRRVRNGNGFRH